LNFNVLVYRIFFNSFTRNGFKQRGHYLAWQIMQGIRTKHWYYWDNHKILIKSMKNVYTPVKVRKKKIAGRIELIPLRSKFRRRISVSVRWFIKVSIKQKKKTIYNFVKRVINELRLAYNKKGEVYNEKLTLESEVRKNRSNTRFLRKRRKRSRRKTKLRKKKKIRVRRKRKLIFEK